MRVRDLPAIVLAGLLLVEGSAPAYSLTFRLPADGDDLVGDPLTIRSTFEGTLPRYARAYGLGYREILAANPGVNPWVPGEGTEVLLPLAFLLPEAERSGIVLNLAELRLYYFPPGGDRVLSYPIGIGREGWQTPVMQARVTAKIENPSWTPPESIRLEHAAAGDPLPGVVPPGPDNPLGRYAIQLDIPGYFLHGTNKPLGVGMRISHGCVRLYPEDIEELVYKVSSGTPVQIVNQPVKAGWHRGALYLEVHEPLEEEQASFDALEAAREAVARALARRDVPVDEDRLLAAAAEARGVPVRVSPVPAVAQPKP
jgi:L,D-transpeptidase ErfK/SrfK